MDQSNVTKKPLVSIIIPVFNVEKYLGQCLESVLNQTYDNLEIIIVNDYSPDGSINIAQSYAANDSRIRIVNHLENKGLPAARNSGLEVATGEFIQFIDSDDWIPLNRIEIMLDYLTSNNSSIVVAGIQVVKENGEKISERVFSQVESISDHVIRELQAGFAVKYLFKSCLVSNIRFNENLRNFEDGDFSVNIILAAEGKITVISDLLYYYRQHSGSITNKPSKATFEYFMLGVELVWSTIIGLTNLNYEEKSFLIHELLRIRWEGYDWLLNRPGISEDEKTLFTDLYVNMVKHLPKYSYYTESSSYVIPKQKNLIIKKIKWILRFIYNTFKR